MTTAPLTRMKTLRIGHTPDPDDAFMFFGFAEGLVQLPGFRIDHVLEDIESLNRRAEKGEIEVTAISAAMVPALDNNYWILPVGASVGRNYGPVVVKRDGSPASPEKRIGIPGKHTTAYLLFQLYAGEGFEAVEYKFDEIPAALKAGEIDYGLLIHEAQITYASLGFEKVLDLGEAWTTDTKRPIPLGLDVVKKSLGRDLALKIGEALKKSIQTACDQREAAVPYAMKFGRGLGKDLGEKFIGMYVNEDTMDLGVEGEKALNLLYDKAYRAGLLQKPAIVDVLRP